MFDVTAAQLVLMSNAMRHMFAMCTTSQPGVFGG